MKAEIRMQDQKPALYINGERRLPILYGLSDIPGSRASTVQAYRNVKAFGEAGVDLVVADTDLRLGWHKATPFDPEPLLAEIAAVRDANPRAYVLLRLHVNPPYFFLRDHPSEQVIYRTPEGDREGIDDGEAATRTIAHDGDRHLRASLASTLTRDAITEKLRLFLRALKDSPEGEAVFAIQIGYAVYGEWHQWGCDVSMPMQNAFRRYLTERYGTDEALRRAWGREDVSLSDAPFHPEHFQKTDDGLFRDPARRRAIEDAQRAHMLVPAECIVHFCHVVKEEVPHMLAGSFFGYFLCSNNEYYITVGHLGFPYLLAHKEDIDFLAGPFAYGASRNPDRMPTDRALLETLRLHGILWLSEMDQHPAGTEYQIGGDPARARETIAMLRRNVLRPLISGMGFWYYDHRLVPLVLEGKVSPAASIYRKFGWWDSELCMNEIAKLQKIANYSLQSKVISEVLVIYSMETLYHMYQAPFPDDLLLDAIGKSGAVYDTVLIDDLSRVELDRYRVIIFANIYRLSPAHVPTVKALMKEKTTVFLYASGYSNDSSLSEENVTAVTGFSVERCRPSATVTFSERIGGSFTNPFGAPVPSFCITGALTSDFEPIAFYGEDDGKRRTYPDAPEKEAPDSYGKIAAARSGKAWHLIAPCPTPRLLRHIFKEAGVHIYTECGEPLMANDSLLLLHTLSGGARTLHLLSGESFTYHLPPETTLIINAKTGEILAE